MEQIYYNKKFILASSGFVSSCATNPIWLVKTRLQLDRSHSSLPMVIRRIHAEGGIFSFWKGLTASWWGISETVIHFVIYEFLKKCLAEHQNKKKDAEKTALDFVGFMACGATSKTCATCVAYPHGESREKLLVEKFMIEFFCCRSGADAIARTRGQIPLVLANTEAGLQGGGEAGSVPGARHAAGEADPQHRHHDGHLRAHRDLAQADVLQLGREVTAVPPSAST